MDSFFAAADNLDNLLDELEENEEGTKGLPKSNQEREATVTALPTLVKISPPILPGVDGYSMDTSEPPPTEKNGNQKFGIPIISESTDKTLCSSPPKPAFLSHLGYSGALSDETASLNGLDEEIIVQEIPNALENANVTQNNIPPNVSSTEENILPHSPVVDTEESNSSSLSIVERDKTELPKTDFLVIENPSAQETALSNSDLLMELFGAVPAPQTSSQERSISSPVLSPLNPFSVTYEPQGEEGSLPAPNPSEIYDWGNTGTAASTLNSTNPFFVASEPLSSNANSEQGVKILEPPFDRNSQALGLNGTSDIALSPPSHIEGEIATSVAVGDSPAEQPKELPSSNNELSSIPPDPLPLIQPEDSGISLDKPAEISSQATESFESPPPLNSNQDAAIVVSHSVQEKQEKSSVGFMRDVALSKEEFERFWEEMEEADAREEPIEPKNDMQKLQDSHKNKIRESSQNPPVQLHPREDVADVSSQKDAITIENSPASIDEDVVIISSVPEEALISESEYEQFLSSEIGETAAGDAVTPLAPNAASIDVPVIVTTPDVDTTHDGSPTFPLPPKTPQNTEPSASLQPQENCQDSENRLSLNIPSTPGREDEEIESGVGYPATPPPPYTEEMHVNYERSISPTHQVTAPGQQVQEQTTLQNNEAQSQAEGAEDDFSLLPSSILESITRPGETKPTWVPDQDAPQCSNCAQKFTFTRRRHHCRACGRVFCAACCSERSLLKYMDYKEARVCLMCSLAIKQADALAVMSQRAAQNRVESAAPRHPNTEVALEATDVGPRPQPPQAPTAVEAVERPPDAQEEQPHGNEQNEATGITAVEDDVEVEGATAVASSTKSVRFADGTRPKHPDETPSTPPPPSRVNRVRRKHGQPKDSNGVDLELPPVIIAHGENGAYAVQENPDSNLIMGLLESGDQNPQSFVLNPNLIVHVKFVTHASHQCWCYWSEGMDSVGQREVVLILEREGLGDRRISQEAFSFYNCIFDRARKGKIFNTTDFMPKTMLGMEDSEDLFGLKENSGFLFVQATSQTLDGLACLKKKVMHFADGYGNAENTSLPVRSMLFAILVQKNEAPWATLFPMRLMLRLGKEMKQYPCPLFSVRRREPVYHELGHTILAILCDFRNFKYRVISVPGLRVVVTSDGSVSVQIPCNRFTDTIRIMNSSNESVIAIGTGTFGPKILSQDEVITPGDGPCDSHLVCVQDQQNLNYHTEIMTMKETKAMNTGAAFVIFNGSLKSDGNHVAKCAIVEDGIMIQLLPEKMEELRACLKSMEDFKVEMWPSSAAVEPTNGSPTDPPSLEVKWVEDDTAFNIGMFSPIDGTPFEGVVGFNVQGRSEQKGRKHTLRWNQVFFLQSTSNPLDMSRLAELVANGCFLALTPVLHELVKHRQHKVAIRVTIHPENVGYVAGSGLHDLPQACMNALDEQLIQTIHNAANSVAVEQEAVIIELLFSILLSRPAYRTA